MNPGLYPSGNSMVPNREMVQVKWVSGATGAVPSTILGFKFHQGIKSVTRSTTGTFRITFQAACAAYIGMTIAEVNQASYANTGACSVYVLSNQSEVVANHYIDIITTNAAGTIVDPTTNDVVCLEFAMSSANPR